MKGTVSDLIMAILKKYDVKYVFGLAAAQIAGIMNAAGRDPHFKYVTVRHEECAGHMAHAASKLSGTVGVCFGTVGPGAANLVPGVAAAFSDNVPLIVITGDNELKHIDPGHDLLQELDQRLLYKAITKWGATLRNPKRVPELVVQALRTAVSGRPGPVHLDLPCDVGITEAEFDLDALPDEIRRPRPVPGAAMIERAADLLLTARQPLLLAGGGVVRSGAEDVFRELIEISGAPATTTLNAKGVVSPDSRSQIGSGGFLAGKAAVRALQEADVLLAVGCKFSSWTIVNKEPNYPRPPDQRIIQIDTMPEAIGKNVRVDLGLLGDARETLRLLVKNLREKGPSFALDPAWSRSLKEHYANYLREADEVADKRFSVLGAGEVLNEAAVARAVRDAIPEDAILCYDGGAAMEWFHTYLQPRDSRSSLYNPGMGHLGTGLPFANAAKLVNPDRPVFCLTGDGAFGLTIQELETAARYGLNIVAVVMNDSHWGMYRAIGEFLYQNPNFGTKLTDVDYGRVAEGFGCYGEKIQRLEDVAPAIERARKAGRPAVLDVVVDWTPHLMDYIYDEALFTDFKLR